MIDVRRGRRKEKEGEGNIKFFFYLYFFFFQAEDGIRDIGVTGVQTCALPISEEDRISCSFDRANDNL